MLEKLRQQFPKKFDRPACYAARAPGRVNLIGEHTDYNFGMAMPMAIDREVMIVAAPRGDRRVRLHSVNFQSDVEFTFDDLNGDRCEGHWSDYIKATAWVLQRRGHPLQGFDGIVYGNIPVASGLSSSAALELASLAMFARTSEIANPSPLELAKLAQQAENEYIGVQCGLMDQLICASGRAGHALLIDFRSLETSHVAIPSHLTFVIGDTRIPRKLAASSYNTRFNECQTIVRQLSKSHPEWNVDSLRDVTQAELATANKKLEPHLAKRLRHVVLENERVLQASRSLQDNDVVRLGELLNGSHESLRNDYEVSCDGLDLLVDAMCETEGCYGARLTGAGFGGCAVAAVSKSNANAFIQEVAKKLGHLEKIPDLFVAMPSDGASIIERLSNNSDDP